MGWMGWTEAETLDTSMPSIVMAYEARIDMLRRIFGGDDSVPTEPDIDSVTAGKLLFAQIRSAAK